MQPPVHHLRLACFRIQFIDAASCRFEIKPESRYRRIGINVVEFAFALLSFRLELEEFTRVRVSCSACKAATFIRSASMSVANLAFSAIRELLTTGSIWLCCDTWRRKSCVLT
jgi:hypothetical protein